MDGTLLLAAVIAVALFFDFTNGFHDAANAIATGISTRALHPRFAVILAAVLNFAGAFASFKVAATIAKGIVNPSAITLRVVLAGLIGAIAWNLLTWYFGLPSSSSHALVGGILGAGVAKTGFDVIQWDGLVRKVLVPSLCAPVFGLVGALLFMSGFLWVVRRRAPGIVNRIFRRLQLVSSSFLAFTHGTNDAQKTMGILALALVASGHLDPEFERPPTWVIVSAASAIAAGTYAGGWRIIRTLGQRIAKLEPPQGFAAEASTSLTLYFTAHYGFPVSTTHTVSGSVLGAGAARRLSAVRWGVAGNIVTAWLLTIPSAALVGAAMQGLTRLPGGAAIVFAVGVAVAALAFAARSRQTRAPEPRPALA
ncbi:MAG: inorganic phosphate transporter [Thermoleophilia bacterium]|nr:inorganic phosphate transporter [Thermoleophilia bacterium]